MPPVHLARTDRVFSNAPAHNAHFQPIRGEPRDSIEMTRISGHLDGSSEEEILSASSSRRETRMQQDEENTIRVGDDRFVAESVRKPEPSVGVAV